MKNICQNGAVSLRYVILSFFVRVCMHSHFLNWSGEGGLPSSSECLEQSQEKMKREASQEVKYLWIAAFWFFSNALLNFVDD